MTGYQYRGSKIELGLDFEAVNKAIMDGREDSTGPVARSACPHCGSRGAVWPSSAAALAAAQRAHSPLRPFPWPSGAWHLRRPVRTEQRTSA